MSVVSVPMQNASAIWKAKPMVESTPIALTIAHGTATLAFSASSLMCTPESNPPTDTSG
jgi:hypothetical protein